MHHSYSDTEYVVIEGLVTYHNPQGGDKLGLNGLMNSSFLPVFSTAMVGKKAPNMQIDLKQQAGHTHVSPLPLHFSPTSAHHSLSGATHSGLCFVLLSLVKQGYAFVLLSCLVQECYLCAGLIVLSPSLPLQYLHSTPFLTRSTLITSLRNFLLI